jgi:type II secretory pathway component GspD/PulD (secretin)
LFILSEGQREEGVEVEKIEPEKGSVKLVWEGAGGTAVRLNDTANIPVPGIVFEDVSLNVVLQLFAQFTNRNLLRSPYLPATSFSLRASAKDQAGAARVLEQALVAKGLSIIPDGEKFLMIVPKSEAARVNPHAPRPKASTGSGTKTQAVTPGTGGTEEEPIAPGLIDFRNADTRQVVDIYSSMVGRTFDPGGPPIVNGTISFRTQTRLTKEEALYAIETMLRWNGIKLVPEGKDKLKAARVQED